MRKLYTIVTVKKLLAEAFPDVDFTYHTAGRGRHRGHAIHWKGGPRADQVRLTVFSSTVKHLERSPTDDELAVMQAQWEVERREREAAEPALRAARKAAGIVKARATRERKASLTHKLAIRWPDTEFQITISKYGAQTFAWTDGPEVGWVTSYLGVQTYHCDRTETEAHKAARIAEARLIRRLVRARARPRIIARGLARRQVAYSIVGCRAARRAAQLAFDL